MITRRTLRRHHLFRPDPAIRQLYLYTLAIAAKEFGMMVHSVTLMSTHEHLIATDVHGRLPDFLRRLHRLVALGTKALRKWEGPTWDHEPTSVVRLLTTQAVIDKLAYVMANPVAAGLVHRARDWPGLTVLPNDLGRRTFVVDRPNDFFDPQNPKWPDRVDVSLTVPPALSHLDDQAFREAVSQALAAREREAKDEVRARGWQVLGSRRIRQLSPYRRAQSSEEILSRNPTFAVGRGQAHAFLTAVQALRAFRRAYREAFEQWRAGYRSVVFPQGTWCMCRLHSARVAE
jgi:hypothetical protein